MFDARPPRPFRASEAPNHPFSRLSDDLDAPMKGVRFAPHRNPEAAMDTLVMALLEEHVPLSLLLDLACPDGPASAEILAREYGDTSWVRRSA
jgi:hypothetical protein